MMSYVAHIHLPVPEEVEFFVLRSKQLHSLPLLKVHPRSVKNDYGPAFESLTR